MINKMANKMKLVNLYCIRHGESIHNILYNKYGMKVFTDKRYYDTDLTHKGFNQAINLGKNWLKKNDIELVIVSPLTRTLKTAMNIFGDTNIPMIALDCVREYPNTLHTCNKRSNISFLQNVFNRIDFSQINVDFDPTWNEENNETIESLLNRINELHDFIEKQNYTNIALIGHNSFISMMKDQKFNRHEDGLQELEYCKPYRLELKYHL